MPRLVSLVFIPLVAMGTFAAWADYMYFSLIILTICVLLFLLSGSFFVQNQRYTASPGFDKIEVEPGIFKDELGYFLQIDGQTHLFESLDEARVARLISNADLLVKRQSQRRPI